MPVLVDPYVSFGGGGGSPGADTFYLATTGNDANPGTGAQPWATFAHAAAQLGAGDTLIVSGGTYVEADINIAADGTSIAPITVVAAAGETPILDGALAAYKPTSNSAWEVFDSGRHIYRTVATLPEPGGFDYTGRIDVGGTLYMLTCYQDNDISTGLAFLSADADLFDTAHPYYMGPGITYNTDGHVYIRLDPNSAAAQWNQVTPLDITDKDPRNHHIYLAPNNNALVIDGNWVTVDGIHMHHHWATVGGNGTDVTFKNLTMRPGRFGAFVNGNRWTFDNVTIDFHRPPWIARSDVKSFPEPGKGSRTGGVDWQGSDDCTFTNGQIIGAFDGMLALNDETGLTVTNNLFDSIMDDGCQTGAGVHGFEFGHNTVTGSGPSHDRSGGASANSADTIYVHHNIFDNTTKVFWSRQPVVGVDPAENGYDGYEHPPHISGHGIPDYRDPWKIYNNTFQNYAAPGQQGANHYLGNYLNSGGQGTHEAYNNIFNFNDDNYVYRGPNASTGFEIYDYNIYSRTNPDNDPPFAIEITDTAGTPVASLETFANWLTSMGGTTGYYPAGWDSHSVARSTMVSLNGSYQPAIGGPADGTGVDLSAKGWPGTTPGTTYIGAKAPV